MSYPRFFIRAADGGFVSGCVQGAGGILASGFGGGSTPLERLQTDARRAAQGLRLSVYEPAPGHVRVYPEYSAAGNGPHVDICIVNATIEAA